MKSSAQRAGRSVVGVVPRNKKQVRHTVDTVLIEPSSLFRVGLEYLLAQTQFRVVARMESGLLEDLPSVSPNAPLLFILGAPDSLKDTMRTAGSVKARFPTARIACIRKSYDSADMTALLGSGVDGLLLRSIDAKILVKSLDLIMSGESIFPHDLLKFGRRDDWGAVRCDGTSETVAEAPPEAGDLSHCALSARERDVLRLLVNGDSNKLIALKLAITEATVKVHVKGVLRKIQVQNRTQAAIWAVHCLSDDKSSL